MCSGFKSYLLIILFFMKSTHRERERVSTSSISGSLSSSQQLGWTKLKLGAEDLVQVARTHDPPTWAVTCSFSGYTVVGS